jgi:Zn-finger nucleic acid-binding protein
MANCPSCKKTMEIVNVEGLDIDRCPSCGGLFFDNFEIQKVEKKLAIKSHELLENDAKREFRNRPESPKLPCPKCEGIIMLRKSRSTRAVAAIEVCGKCGGIWAEAGVLSEIHAEENSEEGRARAANSISNEKEYQRRSRHSIIEKNREHLRQLVVRSGHIISTKIFLG